MQGIIRDIFRLILDQTGLSNVPLFNQWAATFVLMIFGFTGALSLTSLFFTSRWDDAHHKERMAVYNKNMEGDVPIHWAKRILSEESARTKRYQWPIAFAFSVILFVLPTILIWLKGSEQFGSIVMSYFALALSFLAAAIALNFIVNYIGRTFWSAAKREELDLQWLRAAYLLVGAPILVASLFYIWA